jgi:hypothetical protein
MLLWIIIGILIFGIFINVIIGVCQTIIGIIGTILCVAVGLFGVFLKFIGKILAKFGL